MKKKVFRSALLALVALLLMTSVAYAYTIKLVTVRIYKHEDVSASNTTLKNYVKHAMSQIMYAVWYGGGQDTQLFYDLKGPYVHDDWDNDGSDQDDDTCKMDPNDVTGYAIYFLENKLPSSYADYDGGHAVVDINHNSTCDYYFNTGPWPTTVHELGHVFGARDRHGTAGNDVMDKYDARRGISTFDTPSKVKIADYVESQPQDLN